MYKSIARMQSSWLSSRARCARGRRGGEAGAGSGCNAVNDKGVEGVEQPLKNEQANKSVPASKRKLERGHFSQSNCIWPESHGRRLIEESEFSFRLERAYSENAKQLALIAGKVRGWVGGRKGVRGSGLVCVGWGGMRRRPALPPSSAYPLRPLVCLTPAPTPLLPRFTDLRLHGLRPRSAQPTAHVAGSLPHPLLSLLTSHSCFHLPSHACPSVTQPLLSLPALRPSSILPSTVGNRANCACCRITVLSLRSSSSGSARR
jgi:hypothetical protein